MYCHDSWNFVWGCTLVITRSCLEVIVIGQRAKSPCQKKKKKKTTGFSSTSYSAFGRWPGGQKSWDSRSKVTWVDMILLCFNSSPFQPCSIKIICPAICSLRGWPAAVDSSGDLYAWPPSKPAENLILVRPLSRGFFLVFTVSCSWSCSCSCC